MLISQVEWGDDSAENDKNLLRYFVTTAAIRRLSERSKSLVIGRKGSGKSALLTKLKQEFSNQKDTSVLLISLKYNSIRAILNDYSIISGFGQEVFFQHTWLRQIYLDIICHFGDKERGHLASNSADFARSIALSEGRTSKDFVENITDVLQK